MPLRYYIVPELNSIITGVGRASVPSTAKRRFRESMESALNLKGLYTRVAFRKRVGFSGSFHAALIAQECLPFALFASSRTWRCEDGSRWRRDFCGPAFRGTVLRPDAFAIPGGSLQVAPSLKIPNTPVPSARLCEPIRLESSLLAACVLQLSDARRDHNFSLTSSIWHGAASSVEGMRLRPTTFSVRQSIPTQSLLRRSRSKRPTGFPILS